MGKIFWISLIVLYPTFCNGQIISHIAGNRLLLNGNSCYGPFEGYTTNQCGLSSPENIMFDKKGKLLFTAQPGNPGFIYKVDQGDTFRRFAGWGVPGPTVFPAPALTAYMGTQRSATIDRWGNVYSTDMYVIYKIDTAGIASIAKDSIYAAQGLSTDTNGNVYFVQAAPWRAMKLNPNTHIVTRVAGNDTGGYSGDGGLAINAKIASLQMRVGRDGSIYLVESFANRIRKVNPSGIITTIAGNGTGPGNGDGGPAIDAMLNGPLSIALDSRDNIYFADGDNTIRRIDAQTGIISTIAGNGQTDTTGDGGLAINAALGNIARENALAFDSLDNLFIAQTVPYCGIRKITYHTGTSVRR